MCDSRKHEDMMEGPFKSCIHGAIHGKALFFQVVFSTYKGKGKDPPRGKNRFYLVKKLLGVKSVELRILRIWQVHNDGVVLCGSLFYEEAPVAHMDPHKGAGKTLANDTVQVENGRIELNIV